MQNNRGKLDRSKNVVLRELKLKLEEKTGKILNSQDLTIMIFPLVDFESKYQEGSNRAQLVYLEQLYTLIQEYCQNNYKSLQYKYREACVSECLLEPIKKQIDYHRKIDKELWGENIVLKFFTDLYVPKGNPQDYLNTVIPNINKWRKLHLISNRLMGNSSYESSGLDGMEADLATFSIVGELKEFLQAYTWRAKDSEQIQKAIQGMNNTLSIHRSVRLHKYQKEYNGLSSNKQQVAARLADIHWFVQNELDVLTIGESLIVPHGYMFEHAGHSALVDFYKIDKDNFKVTFVNTGAGALAHLKKITSLSSLFTKGAAVYNVAKYHSNYCPFVNLSFDEIIKDELIEMILAPTTIESATLKDAVNLMNQPLCDYDKKNKVELSSSAIELQKHGTCAHSCWRAWLSLKMDPILFFLFELYYINKASDDLLNYCNGLSETVKAEKKLLLLYEDGKAYCSAISKQVLELIDKLNPSILVNYVGFFAPEYKKSANEEYEYFKKAFEQFVESQLTKQMLEGFHAM